MTHELEAYPEHTTVHKIIFARGVGDGERLEDIQIQWHVQVRVHRPGQDLA